MTTTFASTVPLCNNMAEEMASTLQAMRRQEESDAYRCTDYFAITIDSSAMDDDVDNVVDNKCRISMAQWCFRVVDYLQYSRETACIAMSYVDRLLMTEQGRPYLLHRSQYRLAVMTSLYTAIKLHEPEALALCSIAKLSQGAYTEQQVMDTEKTLLEAIGWRMNPPTPMAFLHSFLTLLPNIPCRDVLMQSAQFQTEVAMLEYDIVIGASPSTIALAALANALHQQEQTDVDWVLEVLSDVLDIERDSELLRWIQTRLWNLRCQLVERQYPMSGSFSSSTGDSSARQKHFASQSSPRTVL